MDFVNIFSAPPGPPGARPQGGAAEKKIQKSIKNTSTNVQNTEIWWHAVPFNLGDRGVVQELHLTHGEVSTSSQ